LRYKQNKKKRIVKITEIPGSRDFENYVGQALLENKDPNFPFKDKLFLAISIAMSKKEYKTKD